MTDVEDLAESGMLIMELIREQQAQLLHGHALKADSHKLSQVGLRLSKILRAYPPNSTIPFTAARNVEQTEESMVLDTAQKSSREESHSRMLIEDPDVQQ